MSGRLRRAAILAALLSAAGQAVGAGEYALPADADAAVHALGRNEFRRPWVPVPEISQWDGLGPLFAARSCLECHMGAALGGRVVIPEVGPVAAPGLVLRLGTAAGEGHPVLGRQLQTRAAGGGAPEGRIVLGAVPGTAGVSFSADAEPAHPVDDLLATALLAPPLLGRAAIDRVDPEAVLALADAQAKGNGPTGRVRLVGAPGEVPRLGRFGATASGPDLAWQIAEAFAIDMGLSSRLLPGEAGDCSAAQLWCLGALHGPDAWREGHEVALYEIALIAAYLEDLDAPAQRLTDPGPGFDDFAAIGCAACHVPDLPDLEGGRVTLYSDLLLHDMGPGLAAPFAPGGGGDGSEWRTAPLLALAPYPGRRYLRDGRAPDLDAAIRAHGGEADPARQAYEALDEPARARLLAFLARL